ncbi:MAG: methyltransferase domain-containing protein [Armatimonadota bacterium]|nr:methyltransferase domain-containing protein [Armatimonadota bacterium]MDR7401611.1 methyltransferase domain-containing protein [Armatimonadota bacterium]MDR7404299.1 methyltransferase domain-containing protein [Armatimonadota bacterium]MDR7436876.1 methyltransferase domain-containing protein [Armatimonadota bacterium]MDR7471583.1 methyltransferase domain-containing protein [Armatimonadota bacterium]
MVVDERWYRRPRGAPLRLQAGGVVARPAGERVEVAVIREGPLGLWSLPKGTVEAGETLPEAAGREVSEETGLSGLVPAGLLDVRERLDVTRTWWNRTYYFLYVLRADTAAPAVQWVPLDDLPPMFWPDQRDLLISRRDEIVRRVRHLTSGGQLASVQFARQAPAYARSRSHRADADLDLLLEHLRPGPGDRVLDVATGTGFTAAALGHRAGRVVGVDLTPAMLAEARRLAVRADWVAGDAHLLPFADGSFTVVACRRAPHHFADLPRAVDEMLRVLTPGGRLGIADQVPPDDPAGECLMETLEVLRDPSHARALPARRWVALLEGRGVRLICVREVSRRLTLSRWLALAGADPVREAAVRDTLARAPRAARDQIGYRRWPQPSFLKRWVVVVGHKVVADD